MAGNPVMLTALAVLQHNDQRLPEYRVELYGSILGWLAAAREHKEGRPQAEECLKYMRKLALHMQDAPDGRRLVQVNKRSAAEFFARDLGGSADENEKLLERETQESGIISSAGSDLRIWHLSFQEYLAALEIGGLGEARQIERVVESGRLYQPEWRETMRRAAERDDARPLAHEVHAEDAGLREDREGRNGDFRNRRGGEDRHRETNRSGRPAGPGG